MIGFIKQYKKVFITILSVVLAVTLGVLCAIGVSKNAKMVWSEISSKSYIEKFSDSSSLPLLESAQQTVSSEISSKVETSAPPPPTVINAYLPYMAQTLEAGSSLKVIISARPDSEKVTATFNGQTIDLQKQNYTETEGFVDFVGNFTLPTGNDSDVNLGKVAFYAKWQEYEKWSYSPNITCLRDSALDRVVVVEVVADYAETFDGNTTNDNSDPRLSYLPKGTVDYKIGSVIYDSKSENSYYKLRCGRRVYIDKKNPPDETRFTVTKAYEGSVPDTNEISLSSSEVSGSHTYITFDSTWKAPFTLEIAPQSYTDPSSRDFTIQKATCSYVDIKFCYTTNIGGDITLVDNPLFYSAQVMSAEGGYILRLNLKNQGAFYGWDCYYNQDGQLVFKFLNPKTITTDDSEYGININGATILIDAGHGGRDIGAEGLMPDIMPEAERNLNVAYKLKAELEKMGATVVMTRYDDTAVTAEGRNAAMRKASPDLCISIHHDSAERQSANGCGVFCFNAFSHNVTNYVFNRTKNAGIYNDIYKKWHYFYLARTTSCPVVLIENGFISSPLDFKGISSDAVNTQKAIAIAQGVADYFKSIQ